MGVYHTQKEMDIEKLAGSSLRSIKLGEMVDLCSCFPGSSEFGLGEMA